MKRERGNALASVLAAAAIILLLVVLFMAGGFGVKGQSTRKDKLGVTVPGAARLKALDVECQSNLRSLKLSIQNYEANDGSFPPSLDDLHVPGSMLKCPIGGEAYKYNAATGQPSCPHPGHEEY